MRLAHRQKVPRRSACCAPRPSAARGHSCRPKCISDSGWQTFADHIGAVFAHLVKLRDGSRLNGRTLIVWHNYARVMPRPSSAGPGFGPRLLPALQRHQLPLADHLAVADELLARLRTLIDSLVAAHLAQNPQAALYVADSISAGLTLSDPAATGDSGNWLNEVHPNRGGYQKCALAWQAVLDPLLGQSSCFGSSSGNSTSV